jgi:hypothetical protein
MIMMFVMYGASFAIQAFTRPVYGVALMLFYYDQRIRQEGFDIEWMMFQAGLVPPAPQPAQLEPQTLPTTEIPPSLPLTTEIEALPVDSVPDAAFEASAGHAPEAATEPAPQPPVTAPPDHSDSTAA